MKNTYKIKILAVWALVLLFISHLGYLRLTVGIYGEQVHAAAPEIIDDRLGEVLDPKGTVVIKKGEDPAWGLLKPPVTIKARLTGYAKGDSCHYPAPKGGCYTSNWPHIAKEGDMACPLEYKYGTKVYRPKTDKWYTCNDRTANWVQDKWNTTPTFDIWSDTAAGIQPKVIEEIIVYPL